MDPVAQLDRVPDSESGGRRFESCRDRHRAAPHENANRRSMRGGVRGICSIGNGQCLRVAPKTARRLLRISEENRINLFNARECFKACH